LAGPRSSQEQRALLLLPHTTGDLAAETSLLTMGLARPECPIQCQQGQVPPAMLGTSLEYLPGGAPLAAEPAGAKLREAAHGAMDLMAAGLTQSVTWDPAQTVRYHPGVGQERHHLQPDLGYKAMPVVAGSDQPQLGALEAVVQPAAMHMQQAVAVRLDGHHRLRAVAAAMTPRWATMTLVPRVLALSRFLAAQGRHPGTLCKRCCGH